MLKIEEIEGEDALYVVSDDANAENAELSEAVNDMAPHLALEFDNTDVVDGVLKWRVARADYSSLLEVLDAVDTGDPEELEAAIELVEAKSKEVVGE